jgi:hypothetical protein
MGHSTVPSQQIALSVVEMALNSIGPSPFAAVKWDSPGPQGDIYTRPESKASGSTGVVTLIFKTWDTITYEKKWG